MEKPLPTLKVARYRRLNYVVRHLYGEVFEILVYHKGSFHSHTHTFTREKNLKKTPYKQAELATITHALNEMATILIDDIIFQWKAYRWDRWVENLKGRTRFINYKLGELKDYYEEKYRRASRRRSGKAEINPDNGRIERGDGQELVEGRLD